MSVFFKISMSLGMRALLVLGNSMAKVFSSTVRLTSSKATSSMAGETSRQYHPLAGLREKVS